jgi:uncharacterized protein (DUF302 family)
MPYIRDTDKSVDQAVADVEAAVQRHEFGILHTYDFRATLAAKGFDLPSECRVLEICNPGLASEMLHNDMTLNLALPCRLSVYEDTGQTKIGMIPPTAVLGLVSQSEELRKAAQEVEKTVTAIIDESI